MLEKATRQAAATDNTILPLTRFDVNTANGIIYTIKEHKITDTIIGLHHLAKEGQSFFGPVAEKILQSVHETIFIYKAVQPINTLNRIVVTLPPNAEYEEGFLHWFKHLQTMSKETGLPVVIYANNASIKVLKETNANMPAPVSITYKEFENWEDFLVLTREVKTNDLFIIVSSRKGYLSYAAEIEKLPKYLLKYFV